MAIYLAAPEVDNDRRALNVFHGMRRAKKEGRWLGHFPNPSEYKELKVKLEEDVARLTIDENRIRQNSTNHYELVDPCLYLLKNIDKFYHSLDTHKKQHLMGSIFPEKFNIKENQVRTTKINEAVLRICRKDRDLGGNKKKQRTIFDALPCEVGATWQCVEPFR